MPCPNALHAHPRHQRISCYKCLAVELLYQAEWPNRAKVVRRARHAVPLLNKVVTRSDRPAPEARHILLIPGHKRTQSCLKQHHWFCHVSARAQAEAYATLPA